MSAKSKIDGLVDAGIFPDDRDPVNSAKGTYRITPRTGGPVMTADKHSLHMPPHVRPEFVAWLAKREAQAGWRGFQPGHEQGCWEAKDE